MTQSIIWACLGIALIIGEMLTGTFMLLFFGAAAFVVAGLRALGIVDSLVWEIILFSLLGIAATAVLRRKMVKAMNPSLGFETDKTLVLSVDINPGESAMIDYQGSKWNATNTGHEILRAGKAVQIARMEGVKLFLK